MDKQILQEIGELFGQFKTNDGSIIDFTTRIRERQENHGQNISYDNLRNIENKQNVQTHPFLSGPSFQKFRFSRYYGWQKEILKVLENKDDVYVVAPPGGGKTTPLMAHWYVNIFLKGKNGDMPSIFPNGDLDTFINGPLNTDFVNKWVDIFSMLLTGFKINGQSADKVLFITPIRVLAFEQAEGFQELLLDLLLFLKSLFLFLPKNSNRKNITEKLALYQQTQKNIPQIIWKLFSNLPSSRKNDFFQFFEIDDETPDIQRFFRWALEHVNSLICVKTGGGSESFSGDYERAICIIATYGSAQNFIKKIANQVKFIVYDEAHLYQPSEYGGNKSQLSEITAAQAAYEIIAAVCRAKETQIAFLSGTINPISANNLANYLNKTYNRRIRVKSTERGDPEAVNKTSLNVIPDDSLRDEKKIVDYIVDWVENERIGNAIILFSKAKILKYVQKAKERLRQKGTDNIANYNISPQKNDLERYQADLKYQKRYLTRDEIHKEFVKYRRTLQQANPPLNRQERNRLLQLKIQELKTMRVDLTPEEMKKKMNEYQKQQYPQSQSEMIERIKNKPGALNITNKELREAVAYGIGYIYTQDEDALSDEDKKLGKEAITESDKKIIAELFSTGKIFALLATPSIGIGVNVSIRNMYLPTLMKFEGSGKAFVGEMAINNKREMSQLVNRAGRGKVVNSAIYTPQEFVPYMKEVVAMGPDDFNEVPAIFFQKGEDPVQFLIDVYHGAIRTIPGGNILSAKALSVLRASNKIIQAPVEGFNKLKKYVMSFKDNAVVRQNNNLIDRVREANREVNQTINSVNNDLDNMEHYMTVLKKSTSTNNRLSYYDRLPQIIQNQLNVIKRLDDDIENQKNTIDQLQQNQPVNQQQIDAHTDNILRLETLKNKTRKKILEKLTSSELNEIQKAIEEIKTQYPTQTFSTFRNVQKLQKIHNDLQKQINTLLNKNELLKTLEHLRNEIRKSQTQLGKLQRLQHLTPTLRKNIQTLQDYIQSQQNLAADITARLR